MSNTRRTVLAWITEHKGSTPTQIAGATGIALNTVKQTVRRMVDDDQLDTTGDGHYFPRRSLSPVSPLSPNTADGDGGDTGDSHSPVLALID